MECPIIIVHLVRVASTMVLFLHLPWDLDSISNELDSDEDREEASGDQHSLGFLQLQSLQE